MAIDYKVLQETKDALQEKVSELGDLINIGRNGKVKVDFLGDIAFTTGQKTQLVNDYTALKAEMVIIFNDLP